MQPVVAWGARIKGACTLQGFSSLTRLELVVGFLSILLALLGFLVRSYDLELLGIVGACFSFGVVVAKAFLSD